MTLDTPAAYFQTSSDRVWDALDRGGFKPEKKGDKFMALCPVHGDTHRSLSVSYDRGRELTLIHCFTCNATIQDVTAALGLTVSDTFDKPLPERSKSTGPKRAPRQVAFRPPHRLPARIAKTVKPDVDALKDAKWTKVTTYRYENADGELVQEVFREHTELDGITHKRFTQRFRGPSGRMVTRKPEGFSPVLYHHGDVIKAIKSGAPVWLLEGEKDCDNAAALGLIATTNAQGAGSFPEELADVLAGGIVNIVADLDVAGYSRARDLSALLTGKGATVRIFLPAVDDDKADLTDHLEAGFGVEDLREISAEDAAALARLGEAKKILSRMGEECRAEVTAHVEAASHVEDPAEHLAHAETWATEAEKRYRTLHEATSGAALFADSFGPVGKAAANELQAVVDDVARLAAEIHEIAGVRIPANIADRLRKADGRVTDISGGASEPPIFRGNDFLPGDDGADNIGVEFRVRKGETVQVKYERDGETVRRRYHRILRGWAEVQNLAVEDDGTGSTKSRPTHEMEVKFFRWLRDDAGDPVLNDAGEPEIEEALVKWDADQIRDGSWTQALPWPGMLETTSRRGKDTAWDAIFNARPAPTTRSTVYTVTGWRTTDAGSFFVHANGAVAKGGGLDLPVDLPDAFAPFKLPEPTTEAAALQQAWTDGTMSIVDELPPRIVAPLLGVAWESVFERVPLITHLVGGRAAYKTSTARLAMQYFAPELNYHGRREILSGANMGGTIIGIIRALATANNLPVLIDDMAPDGDAKKAQKKLSELARLIYNGTGRVTGKQRGGINSDAPTQASVITTGELGITGSGQTRLLCIPLDPGAIADGSNTFADLERSFRRNARGLLGASLIRWIAEHREALQAERAADADNPTREGSMFVHWSKRVAALPHDEGLKGRLIEAAMAADHGIKLMLRMMVSTGAMTSAMANSFYQWAEGGIYEAVALQDSAAGDPAEQLLGYLREALASGAGHLTNDDGGTPENASGLGWTFRGKGEYGQYVPNGARLGIIKFNQAGQRRVYLLPSVAIGAAQAVANRADETFAETNVSISSALAAHGWLEVDKSGKRGVGRRIDGQLMRVWDIPYAVLAGDDDSNGGTDEPLDVPPVIDPGLFDISPEEVGEAPTPEPHPQPTPAPAAPAAVATIAPAHAPAPAPVPRQAAPAPQRGVVKRVDTFRASLAVLHTDGVWLPDGHMVPLYRPIVHLGDVADLGAELNLGTQNGWKAEDGQLLVTYDAALDLGIPVDRLGTSYGVTAKLKELTLNHPLVTKAIDAGYQVGGREKALNATTRVWSSDNPRVRARFVLLPALKDDFKHIVADDPSPAAIADRLQRFANALHTPYAVSASTTGLDLMFHLPRKKEQRELYFAPSNPVPPAEIPTLEADIDWQRTPNDEERTHQWDHAYDRGGSYLAGVSGLELGYGEPTYFAAGREFDKKLPGYWRIEMPAKAEWLIPNPIDPRNRDEDITGRLTWVTTQTLDVAAAFGYTFDVVEAYVWEQHGRILETWYERVRDARTALDTDDVNDQAARNLIKETYVRTLGLMASFEHHKDREGFAPERYHLIQARSRANIIRRVQKIGEETGRWPVAISKDTVIYTSNEADPIAAWPGDPQQLGRGLGQYKPEGSAPLADHLQYLTGHGRYDGKNALQ